MQGIICREINYTEEAFMLLMHMADGDYTPDSKHEVYGLVK